MNTQELKQYIDRVLGNNIRCLLPSYWWKRLFNQVADRIDDKQDILVSGKNIKTINGKDLLGEGDTNADIIINSVDELNALNVQQGTIASVAISQGEGNFVNCYQSSEDELIENLESGTGKINEEYLNKLTRIYGISRIELPDEPFNETIETYLIHYAQDGNSYFPLLAVYSSDGTSSGTYMQIFDSKMSFFKDDGTLNEDAFTALSQYFQYPTYYLCTVGDGNLLSKVFIPTMDYSDIYIKESADSWTKYSKHTYVKSLEDRINIVQDTISSINNETQINNKIVSAAINDLNDRFKGVRFIYASEVRGNMFATTTVELTEEQKLYNLESVQLALKGKAFLGVNVQGTVVYFTLYDQSGTLYTTLRAVNDAVIIVKAEFNNGNFIITVDVEYPDSELSSTSMASVQNKVITSEINKLNTKIAELENQLTALQNNQ